MTHSPRRILYRAGKAPREVASHQETLERSLNASNTGNMLFQESVFRSLAIAGHAVEPNRYRAVADDAERINASYDMLVLPLANAFRASFASTLDQMSALIERLRIPVVVVGVGVQASMDYDFSRLRPIEASVKRFLRAVLDRSASIGVRGECTAAYVQSLGFSETRIIGCPSMFMDGPVLEATRRVTSVGRDTRIGVNITSKIPATAFSEDVSAMGQLVAAMARDHDSVLYVPQENRSLELLLHGWSPARVAEHADIPKETFDALYGKGAVRFFVDPTSWRAELREVDFVFGTRLHGCIAGILSGAPSLLVVCDSRTRELAEYFELPSLGIHELDPRFRAEDLLGRCDPGPMHRGHRARYERYLAFLDENGVPHGDRLEDAAARRAGLEAELRSLPLPGPAISGIVPQRVFAPGALVGRLRGAIARH